MVLPMRGTLLNTATVAVGACVGWALGARVPDAAMQVALSALGLVTVGIGVKMFLESKNVLVLAFALSVGGVIGLLIGVQTGLESFAEWARVSLGPLALYSPEGRTASSGSARTGSQRRAATTAKGARIRAGR